MHHVTSTPNEGYAISPELSAQSLTELFLELQPLALCRCAPLEAARALLGLAKLLPKLAHLALTLAATLTHTLCARLLGLYARLSELAR